MTASLKMVSNLQKYTDAIAQQIQEIQTQLEGASSNVMSSLLELSSSTEEKKAEAERVLEQTYLAPDANTAAMVDSVQKSTDDIFALAEQELAQGKNGKPQETGAQNVDKDIEIRRMAGLFSKHMESLSTLDDSLKDVVFSMVGCLSSNDVIKQRLDHVSMMLTTFQLGMSNVIVDLDTRLTRQMVSEFKDNLLDYAYRTYSTELEKNSFKQIFGAPPSIKRAYTKAG